MNQICSSLTSSRQISTSALRRMRQSYLFCFSHLQVNLNRDLKVAPPLISPFSLETQPFDDGRNDSDLSQENALEAHFKFVQIKLPFFKASDLLVMWRNI